MAKKTIKKTNTARRSSTKERPEKDSIYLLKLLLYMMVGTFYVRLIHEDSSIPIPFGLIIGLAFALHEHFRIDRKVELAVLVIASAVGLVAGYGVMIYY